MGIRETEAGFNLKNNMQYLMEKNGIRTGKQLAKLLNISESLLTRVKKASVPLVYPLLNNVKDIFGYTIDEMLYTNIREKEEKELENGEALPEKTLTRYLGIYQVYHYKTTSFRGRETGSHGNALQSGVIYVYRDPNHRETHKAYGFFTMERSEADELYTNIRRVHEEQGPDGVCSFIESIKDQRHVYEGHFEITAHQLYLSFAFSRRDRVFVILHQTDGTKNEFIGGLGCMLSTSKGRIQQPCMQRVAVSMESLPGASDEIASFLVTQYPSIKAYEYMDEIMTFLDELYKEDKGTKSRLKEEEKRTMILYYIDKVIQETVEKNNGRISVITADDDNSFYHYCKIAGNVRKTNDMTERGD